MNYGANRERLLRPGRRAVVGRRSMVRIVQISALATALAVTGSIAGERSHPCASKDRLTGILATGSTADAIRLVGSDQLFAVSGLYSEGYRSAETSTLVGEEVTLHRMSKLPDRYERIAVQVFAGTKWLQGRALADGHALVSALHESRGCRHAMLERERAARVAGRGIWAGRVQVLSASKPFTLLQYLGRYMIIEGRVLSVGDRQRRLYLNFGQKWSQDFTALVVKKGTNAFKGNIEPFKNLRGKSVRIRGILEQSGGPMVRLMHEGQIEVDVR